MEIKLYRSPWKALRLVALCTPFVAIGCWGIRSGEMSAYLAWTLLLFFGLGYPGAAFMLLDRRPQIIISEIGIFDRTTHRGFINWEIIHNAYLVTIHGQPIICLLVDEAFKPSRKKGRWAQSLSRLNEGLGFQELNLSLGMVDVNAERFLDFLLMMSSASQEKRAGLITGRLGEGAKVF
ncbi:STM3941 family protein [Hufsiella ginkgonis]|uniref:Uncharacterized protein n=1 Tax=Hufsiella ginkgonis TaxID=2695274 RepID=A0A7K1XUZ3_9SPHI|nr:STM3941 family protein [Hufsiella ginkgonis]MXV14790.1 hypothetical protein [Hufsiella ginkgonis]